MRKLAALAAVLLTLLTMAPAASAEAPVRVVVGFNPVDFDTPPILEGGTTLVPLRPLAEALGFAVTYEPVGRHITLTSGDRKVELTATTVVGNRTMVPLRFVSEQLGAVVTWNERDRLIHIERGEDYARGLYETAVRIAVADPYSDQKSTASYQTTMRMSGPDLPPGGLSIEMPIKMEMHLYQGDLLMAMTLSEPGLTGPVPMTTRFALKDGLSYMQVPGSEQWMVTGPGSLADQMQVGSLFGIPDTADFQNEALKGAKFRLAGFEEIGGRRVARIDVEISPDFYNDLYSSMLGPVGMEQGGDMSISMADPRMSQWVDTTTGKTDKLTVSMTMSVRGEQPGQEPFEMNSSITAEITYSHVSEPISFPDLSGAIDPDNFESPLDGDLD